MVENLVSWRVSSEDWEYMSGRSVSIALKRRKGAEWIEEEKCRVP